MAAYLLLAQYFGLRVYDIRLSVVVTRPLFVMGHWRRPQDLENFHHPGSEVLDKTEENFEADP